MWQFSRRQLLLLLLLKMLDSVDSYCPHSCHCNDTSLSVVCFHTDMKVMPISLNPSIESLVLQNNQFTTVDASISFYPRLRRLDLASNLISRLPDRIFLSQQNLLHLQLHRNNISALSSQSFFGLKQLLELNLSGNPLGQFGNYIFQDLSNLQRLDLSCAGLHALGNLTFTGLSSLLVLKLNNNFLKVDSFAPVCLDPLVGLRSLDLADNGFNSIPSREIGSLSSLEELDLSGNPFDCIHTQALAGNLGLRVLQISRCPNLVRVERDALGPNLGLQNLTLSMNELLGNLDKESLDLPSLVHLDISGNSLRSMEGNLSSWSGIFNLQLAGNPWHCDCSTLNLRRLIEEHILRGGSPMRRVACSSPQQYEGTDVLFLPDAVCSHTSIHSSIISRHLAVYLGALILTSCTLVSVVLLFIVASFHSLRRVLGQHRLGSASSSAGTQESYYQVQAPTESPKCCKKIYTIQPFEQLMDKLMSPSRTTCTKHSAPGSQKSTLLKTNWKYTDTSEKNISRQFNTLCHNYSPNQEGQDFKNLTLNDVRLYHD